jgi:hypothetical protein
MINFNFFKKQRPPSILGLALEGNRLEAVVLRRSNASLRVQQSAVAALALSPLTGDPELVGRELRNHLNQAGIRQRRCAVCLPSSWALTLQTKLPDLPEADIASFLQIEAERGFHSGQENLLIGDSRFRAPNGEKYATLMAIPRNHIATLEKALKAAQLKPASFALGIAALENPDSSRGSLSLTLGGDVVDLLVTSGGGIVALRSLGGAIETEGSQKRIDADVVAREIRITLGQLPPGVADGVRSIRIFGRGELSRQFVNDISPRLQSMALKLELMDRVSAAEFEQPAPADITLSPALALAANWLRGTASGPEFLPPKVQPWKQFLTTKAASKKLGWAGAAAGGLAACVAGAFLIQQWQLSKWDSKWRAMEPQVKELQDAQQQIRKYRPWFDESFRGLRILRKLTEAFPEDGVVFAKNVEIRDLSTVNCSGTARDNQSYLRLIDQLRAAKEVTGLKTDSLSGQSPTIQFTFNFQWEGENGGN